MWLWFCLFLGFVVYSCMLRWPTFRLRLLLLLLSFFDFWFLPLLVESVTLLRLVVLVLARAPQACLNKGETGRGRTGEEEEKDESMGEGERKWKRRRERQRRRETEEEVGCRPTRVGLA